ncbi:UDP-phosphate glycosyltransferase [Nocardioides sp. KIGAM211]|uniref:UDP-phosphate glycosyltransferase n=1 Tax=Nocardioides luti TaxID=2761101 RepID=A0A7X0VBJ5_9ACTN|nr:UDP-phosphate glycosyltransferase [Nocardioides luti]
MTPFWVALAVGVLLTGLAVPLLRRASMIDRPNHRSSHDVPVPRGGGVAVVLAVLVGVALDGGSDAWAVVVPALLLAAVGLTDDLRSLSARLRLTAQLVVAVGLCAWVAATQSVTGAALPLLLVIGVVGVVGFVNAFNFMDGINGISALHAAVSGGWFAWLGHDRDLPVLLLLGLVVAGGALGFLPWNALGRVFLGDVGSYGIGALLAGTAITAWALDVPVVLAVAPLLVYLADTSSVMLRRARAGEPLFEAHRQHAYQRLVQQGWPHLGAAAWSAAVSVAVVLVLAGLYPDHAVVAVLLAVALLAAYLATPRLVEARHREGVSVS